MNENEVKIVSQNLYHDAPKVKEKLGLHTNLWVEK